MEIKVEPANENAHYQMTDTHGDMFSLIYPFLKTGAFKLNGFTFYNIENGTFYKSYGEA
jgi:hypothetical protein